MKILISKPTDAAKVDWEKVYTPKINVWETQKWWETNHSIQKERENKSEWQRQWRNQKTKKKLRKQTWF